jgi:hypothetical protein
MKRVRRVGLVTSLLCITALLIAAFMVLFSNAGNLPDDQSKENSSGNTSVVSEPAVDLK